MKGTFERSAGSLLAALLCLAAGCEERRGSPAPPRDAVETSRKPEAGEPRPEPRLCTAVAVLEAAHILPYRGEHTHRVDNGLLLRSDLHTLFDLGLLWITADHTVAIAAALTGTEYEALHGQPMRLPERVEHHPNPAHLADHAKVALEKQR